MTTRLEEDEFILDPSEYTVEVAHTTRRYISDESYYMVDTMRYTSEKSGIVVEVEEHAITIQSTAERPPRKRSRGTNEEARLVE